MNKESLSRHYERLRKNGLRFVEAVTTGSVAKISLQNKKYSSTKTGRPKAISLNKLQKRDVFKQASQQVKTAYVGLGPRKKLAIVAGSMMVVVFFAVLIAQKQSNGPALVTLSNGETSQEDAAQVEVVQNNINASLLDKVVHDPKSYAGDEIELKGRIKNAHNDRIFTLTDPDSGKFIYIITPRSLNSDESEKTKDLFDGSNSANATGTIKTFNNQDLLEQFNITLADDLAKDFASKRLLLIVKTFTISRN